MVTLWFNQWLKPNEEPKGRGSSRVLRLLAEPLKARDARVWVQGLVVFTNPEADLYIPYASNVPILRPGEVADYQLNFPKRGSTAAAQRATQELITLARNPPVQAKI